MASKYHSLVQATKIELERLEKKKTKLGRTEEIQRSIFADFSGTET